MRYYVLILGVFSISLIAGCITQMENKDISYKINPAFASQFDELVEQWKNITEMKIAKTEQGFYIYFDKQLNVTNVSCSNKMIPTFDCKDLLLEYEPVSERDLSVGDIISFEIYPTEAQMFSEEPFQGKKIIQRRIFRIGNDEGIYFIVKRDSADTTHKVPIAFQRIKGKVIGFVFNATLENNKLLPYTEDDRSLSSYNQLVSKWNSFVDNVYKANIEGRYMLFYDRKLKVPPLACTGSMRPTLDCDDLVMAYNPNSEKELAAGDIISFRIAPNETSGFLEPASDTTIHVMHRIFRITKTQNRTAYITKGDNTETNKQTDAIHLDFGRIESKAIAYFKNSYNSTFEKDIDLSEG